MTDLASIPAARRDLDERRTTSRTLVEAALTRAADPTGEGGRAFTRLHRGQALAVADATDRLHSSGIQPASPIAGLPVSVKDLFDIAGEPTTAGSRVLADAPPARRDATIVARLRRAGAAIVGRTNMTEFAFSGLGLNPHYGTPRSPWDRATGRIPGGSSSGAAVSVSDGMAIAAIGTDTGGSVRLPAAFCGLVGFKPTAARIPRDGCLPLSHSLDSIGPLARTVTDCVIVDSIISGDDAMAAIAPTPRAAITLALPGTVLLDDLDPAVARAFERALAHLSAAGCRIVETPLAPIARVGELTANGGFAAAEAWAQFRTLLASREQEFDPRVARRMRRGEAITGADYVDLVAARRALVAEMNALTEPFTAVVSPTIACLPPPIDELARDDQRYAEANMRILRNTTVANYLDRCAITLPCAAPGEPPVGLMLMGARLGDRALLAAALSVEAILAAAWT